MTDLDLNASAGIDLSTQFCAKTYYTGLRDAGCDPVVYALHIHLGESSVSNLNKWAARHDPDGALRLECARAAWAKRTSDDEIIALGIRQ
jgi:hypothetical protein